jgi:hypothetical protein
MKKKLPDGIAYMLDDSNMPPLAIKKSANAWWRDGGKVDQLIWSFKMGNTVKKACEDAGISLDQYRYFKKKHPDFCAVKLACDWDIFKEIRVQLALSEALEKGEDKRLLMWAAERLMPEKWGKHRVRLGA